MKKQFTKIKIAAENLSRSNKPDRRDFELEIIEKQVEKYRDVLEKMVRKLPSATVSSSSSTAPDTQEREKRIRKQPHYKIGTALEESSKDLSKDVPLYHALLNCGELEKSIAECIVDTELETESEVVRRLKLILDNEIQEISTLKRNVSRTVQEYASLKRSYETAIRLDEPQAKINHIKDQQEQCEVKLEKERDSWAAQMFELIAKEDVIVHCIRDYILNQRNYHERALQKVNNSLASMQDIIQNTGKSRFGTSLIEHLTSTNRDISYIIELCVCCLVESGLCEEGLLRVGCASTKLKRMKYALEAEYVKAPLPVDYQDPHVIGSILKLYLRELPEPLLTYTYYADFIRAVEQHVDQERKIEIKACLSKLPQANYQNLRYLTKFLWLVTQYVNDNKMNSQNLAIVMSPNMLWPRVDKNSPADYIGQVNCSSAVNVIIELLISQWDYFFEGDVDFFITLQRGKLFVEHKSKSSSSNENLDRPDNDVSESPRYGTIRRQKACAPSPPTKLQNVINSDINGDVHQKANATAANNVVSCVVHSNQNSSGDDKSNHNSNNNSNDNNSGSAEKVEKVQSTAENVKPVPMTRTQFLYMDNAASPVADRKSNDSLQSLAFKPDLPQKPKIPRRPIALGLNNVILSNCHKNDDEVAEEGNIGISGVGGERSSFRAYKTAEQLVQEHCDNITALQANIGYSNSNSNSITSSHSIGNSNNVSSSLSRDTSSILNRDTNYINQQQQQKQQLCEKNANIPFVNKCTASLHSAATATVTTTTPTAITKTTQSMITNEKTLTASTNDMRITPTTPISPSIPGVPKRPTVPAPPPPNILKKQTD